MNREETFSLLKKYNKENFHIKHALIVEGVMKYFAEKLGYGDEKEFWKIVGNYFEYENNLKVYYGI